MKELGIFFAAIVLGIFLMFGVQQLIVKNSPKPDVQYKKIQFSPEKPPSRSLTGSITTLEGDIAWQSRIATEAARITQAREIQQGEAIKTAKGSAVVQFENIARLTISPNSEIDFTQTLPTNFIFFQTAGKIEYNRLGKTPLSIRALHLLIDQDLGDITVGLDKDQMVTINVNTGKIKVAYNDLEFNSQLLDVDAGKRLIFHDDVREAELK